MVVSNTDSDVVFEIASQNYYVLLSGRWYRTKDLDNGPWTWVANDELSAQFSEIPADSDVGYLRSSVAGTEEAREALLEQSVPQTAAVKTTAGASFTVDLRRRAAVQTDRRHRDDLRGQHLGSGDLVRWPLLRL